MTDETVCTGFFRAATEAKGDISCLDQFQSSGVLQFISGNFLEALYNVPVAIINASMWLDWLTWENTLEDKQSLMRFVYYGGSVEFFFVLATLILGMTIYGLMNNKFMWGVVRCLEGFANTVGRFFAWAGLLMVLQQIMIVFLQRIFTRPDISIGFGIPLQFDISWFAEELKLYNALVVCMCVTYAFVQGSHVRVDLVYAAVKFRTKKMIDMFGSLIFMVPSAVLTWMYGWYFLWRHLIVPNPSASDSLDRLVNKARALRWNVETIGFSPNGFTGYFLFKILLVTFTAMVFIHAIAFFYRSFLEWKEGEESENKYLDKDTLGEGEEAYEGDALMLFGLDGVEVGLIIVFITLFGGILSGFPVAFAIGGAGIISFGIIASLDSAGLLVHQAIDDSSQMYQDLITAGVGVDKISIFRYPELPRVAEAVFPKGWEVAMDRNVSFVVNRMNERVLAGQSIETLLAVLMFVLMGITLERSKIANDLLTTMARVFGPLPGGLAVSVVVVGAFLAASTGIVGATVVTMGLLALPTMLRNGYSPEIATGVIAASGTLGQIIPPSIVIVLLGTLAGDLYSSAQEARAISVGCTDALSYLGEPAVLSVGTLFQAALVPGILLAVLYALYAFGYALLNPDKAPAVQMGTTSSEPVTRSEAMTFFLFVPIALVVGTVLLGNLGIIGGQSTVISAFSDIGESASLRTNVSEACKVAMIELHGLPAWDAAIAQQVAIEAAGGVVQSERLSEDAFALAQQAKIDGAAPIGTGTAILLLLFSLVMVIGRGVSPSADKRPLIIGGIGVLVALLVDIVVLGSSNSAGSYVVIMFLPFVAVLYGVVHAAAMCAKNELIRVVFPPLMLIVAVLGSILGGITNPTPAAALGAGGAIMLAAYRKLSDTDRSPKVIIWSTVAIGVCILVGINFDLRINQDDVSFESWFAFFVAYGAYLYAMFGLLFSCWILFTSGVLTPVVRETAKVTSMVFTILIGSQLLNLVVISFGGEHYIQQFLKSFDNEITVFLIVMLVLFVLGFVLDFLEIIYIVIPIVGPVIYGGTFDPKWVTIMIAVNLQTSFLTPPFGFALFYLRGVAPKEVTTRHIYRGIVPFVLIQIAGLALLWTFPSVVTFLPDLIPN